MNKATSGVIVASPTFNGWGAQKWYVDDTLSNYDSSGQSAPALPYGTEIEPGAARAVNNRWTSKTAGDQLSLRLDMRTPTRGRRLYVSGIAGTSSYYRPTAAKLERSNDASEWGQVANYTNMTTEQPGWQGWCIEFNIEREGAYRYWRVTLTTGGANLAVSRMILV